MKKAYKILVAALLMAGAQPLVPTHTQAQITHASQGNLDENATEALAKAAKKMNQNVSFSVRVQMLDAQKKTVADLTAQVRYNKGKYHVIHPDLELFCDGTTVWHYDKQAAEVAVNNANDGTDDINLLNPGKLLTDYNSKFRAKYIRTDDDGAVVVDLQPRSAQYYHKIRLFIDEESGLLRRAEVHKFDSGREIYTISDFRRSLSPASEFVFNTKSHPNVEVIDMR